MTDQQAKQHDTASVSTVRPVRIAGIMISAYVLAFVTFLGSAYILQDRGKDPRIETLWAIAISGLFVGSMLKRPFRLPMILLSPANFSAFVYTWLMGEEGWIAWSKFILAWVAMLLGYLMQIVWVRYRENIVRLIKQNRGS